MSIHKRERTIKALIKEAKMSKVIEDINNNEDINKIEDGKEYAHQVFLEVMNNLYIEGLDD